MKRMWIGVGLLVLALVGGVLSAEWMDKTHESIGADIEQAAVHAMAEEWSQADALTHHARRAWEKKRPVIAALADHEPLETVDSLFDQLKVYSAAGDSTAYCVLCADLRQLLEALGDYNKLTVSNLL